MHLGVYNILEPNWLSVKKNIYIYTVGQKSI